MESGRCRSKRRGWGREGGRKESLFIEEENKRTTGDERDGGRRGREGDLEGNVEVDVKGKCGEEKIEAREEKGGFV